MDTGNASQVSFKNLALESMGSKDSLNFGAITDFAGIVFVDNVQFANNSGPSSGGDILVQSSPGGPPTGLIVGGALVEGPPTAVNLVGSGISFEGDSDGNISDVGSINQFFLVGASLGDPQGNGAGQATPTVIGSVISFTTDGESQLVVGGFPDSFVSLDPYSQVPEGTPVQANNLYNDGTIILSGELALGRDGSAGTGAIYFGASTSILTGPDTISQTLLVDFDPLKSAPITVPAGGDTLDHGASQTLATSADSVSPDLQNVLTNFGVGDFLEIVSLPEGSDTTVPAVNYVAGEEEGAPGTLSVTYGGVTKTFLMTAPPNGTRFEAKFVPDPGVEGGLPQIAQVTLVSSTDDGGVTPPGGTNTPSGGTTLSSGTTPSSGVTPSGSPITTPQPTTSPNTNNTSAAVGAPVIAFDPDVSVSHTTVTMTGTVSDTTGAPSVELVKLAADGSVKNDLGAATVDFDATTGTGTWSFDFNGRKGFNTDLAAIATSPDHQTSTALSHYNLTTKVAGAPYTTVQDSYSPDYTFEGQTYLEGNGHVYYKNAFDVLTDGVSYTYSGGNKKDGFFADKDYSSFVDTYMNDADGNMIPDIATHVENNVAPVVYSDIDADQSFSHKVSVEAKGLTVRAIDNDLFTNGSVKDTTFVFGKGFGHEEITAFRSGDTIELAQRGVSAAAETARLNAAIAGAKDDGHGDAVLNFGHGDKITLDNVSLASLALQHDKNFLFV